MTRRIGAALLGTAALITMSVAGALPASAASHIVQPGESIQEAVDAAEEGDTIVVRPGTYAEAVFVGTDGLTLVGHGARIVPPAEPALTPCAFDESGQQSGICVLGEVDPGTGEVLDRVRDVTVTGFHVSGFADSGIIAFGGEDIHFLKNTTVDNEEYGLARFDTVGGSMSANKATGSHEAGLYLGDSQGARADITGNQAWDNGLFGIFVRDSSQGSVTGNQVRGNCLGVIVLNTYAESAHWRIEGNLVRDNTKACAADEEEGVPPLSGAGIALVGARDNDVAGNVVLGNRPSGPSLVTGGIAVITSPVTGTAPEGNTVRGNVLRGNEPDLFWDGTGEGNTFTGNLCRTSEPEGLC